MNAIVVIDFTAYEPHDVARGRVGDYELFGLVQQVYLAVCEIIAYEFTATLHAVGCEAVALLEWADAEFA